MPAPALLSETLLTFAQAAVACPMIGGHHISAKTIYVWADKGVKVGEERIRLETARVGGRRVTSREALERFFEATASTESEEVVIRSPAQRRRDSEAAKEWLRREFAKVK